MQGKRAATVAQAQKQEEKSDTGFKGNVAQLLGIRGGDKTTNIWKIRLQLCKPVTWIPLIWGRSAAARKLPPGSLRTTQRTLS